MEVSKENERLSKEEGDRNFRGERERESRQQCEERKIRGKKENKRYRK